MNTFKGEDRERVLEIWEKLCYGLSLQQAQDLAADLDFSFYFNWETCRTEEGYYKVEGCIEYCVQRTLLFSNFCDMIWMETDSPNLNVANEFSSRVHAVKPHVMLAYNLSPSFNWDAHNMTEEDMENFIPNLASMGYVW